MRRFCSLHNKIVATSFSGHRQSTAVLEKTPCHIPLISGDFVASIRAWEASNEVRRQLPSSLDPFLRELTSGIEGVNLERVDEIILKTSPFETLRFLPHPPSTSYKYGRVAMFDSSRWRSDAALMERCDELEEHLRTGLRKVSRDLAIITLMVFLSYGLLLIK